MWNIIYKNARLNEAGFWIPELWLEEDVRRISLTFEGSLLYRISELISIDSIIRTGSLYKLWAKKECWTNFHGVGTVSFYYRFQLIRGDDVRCLKEEGFFFQFWCLKIELCPEDCEDRNFKLFFVIRMLLFKTNVHAMQGPKVTQGRGLLIKVAVVALEGEVIGRFLMSCRICENSVVIEKASTRESFAQNRNSRENAVRWEISSS